MNKPVHYKRNVKTLLLSILLALTAMAVLAGCSSKPATENTVTMAPGLMLEDVLTNAEDVNGALMDLTQEQVNEFFAIPAEVNYEGLVKISMMNVKSNEVGIFKVEDVKDVEAVKAGIQKRMSNAIAGWMPGYMPDEITKMENYTMESKGNYVIYVVADEASKALILDNFQKHFEKK